ncbi:MAG TPA: trypsin-like peptidase domain-containing protein, partial [Chloroflexota bacterium]
MARLQIPLGAFLAALVLLSGCNVAGTTSGSSTTSAANVATRSSTAVVASPVTSSTTSAAASSSAGSQTALQQSSATLSSGSTATRASNTATTAQTVAGIPTPLLVPASVPLVNGQTTLATDSIINVARKDTPGVVQITNEQVQLGSLAGIQAVPAGVGTGIILDAQGHILTNDHVVRGAQKLVVALASGKQEYPATLVGADPRTDLAVIQVSDVTLSPLALGDSSKLAVGQWVVAIGNALALP